MIEAGDVIAPVGAVPDALLVEIGAARAVVVTDPVVVAQGYVEAAETVADAMTWTLPARRDRAVVAHATAAAFAERAGQILAAAMSASGDRAGSVGYSTSQAQELEKKAAAWRAVWDAAVLEERGTTAPDAVPLYASRSVPVQVVW